MKNSVKRVLSMFLCLTMVLGLFCFTPEASALDSSGYECTGSVEQLLKGSTDAVAGQNYRIVNNADIRNQSCMFIRMLPLTSTRAS